MLALIGGSAGVVLAIWGLDLLRSIGAQTVPRLAEVNLDLRVLLVTLGTAVLTGIVIGLIPALASGKPELTEALKEGGRGSTSGLRRNRLRNALVVAEVALALVLLVGAGLLLKSFVRLQNVHAGFEPKNVLTMEVALPLLKYPRGKPVADFYAEATRRIKALPGVEAAAFTTHPAVERNQQRQLLRHRRPRSNGGENLSGRRDSRHHARVFLGPQGAALARPLL